MLALAVLTTAATPVATGTGGWPDLVESREVQAALLALDPEPGDAAEATGPVTAGATAGAVDDGGVAVQPVPVVLASTANGSGIPGAVLAAYQAAERTLAGTDPSCRISWSLLAGVGRVESGHASGGRVDENGTTRGEILGLRLDGGPGIAAISDTDGGRLDGDTVWDRAVGPMQFIPGTWKAYAADGNGDGVASPHNVFDAALAAGNYLCAGGGDLVQPAAQRAALMRYNRSAAYGALVLRWAAAYAAGVSVLPSLPGDVPATPPPPPLRVPAPAASELSPETAAALAAPAPVVEGPVASASPAPVADPAVTDPEVLAPTEPLVEGTPAPTTGQPVPTTTQPVPTTEAPAPTAEQPAPTTDEPAPTSDEPAPTTDEPAPTTAPARSEPTTAEPATTEPAREATTTSASAAKPTSSEASAASATSDTQASAADEPAAG